MRTVALFGVARSGTSWLGQVFNSSPDVVFRFQPLFAFEFKGRVDEDSTRAEYERVFEDMAVADTPFLTQREKQESGIYPNFRKSAAPDTLVFKEARYQSVLEPMLRRVPGLKALGLVRDPRAVLNSWRKNAKEFPPGSDIMREWRFGNCKNSGSPDYFGYYKWKEVAHLYVDLEEQYPDRFRVLRYEDAVHDPLQVFPGLFSFCGIPYTQQTEDFLLESSKDRSSSTSVEDRYYSVFKDKSVVDKWRKELDPYIIEEIKADLRSTRLEQFLS
ncbi:MAG: sulfotransferase domain-containing protein [Flavobacteriales bacterium]|nr:sulfotransferase domain-containing protein [Flavobacteriales bacterium]